MSTARIKQDLENFVEAAEAIHHGDYLVAENAIGLGGLSLVQLNHGVTQRLKAAYLASLRKHVPAALKQKAHKLLVALGVTGIEEPPSGKRRSAAIAAIVARIENL